MKLSAAIEEFKEWRGFKVSGRSVVRYDRVLRIFCLTLGDPEVSEISISHVLRYMSEMERLGWQRNGLNIVAIALRKFFEYLTLGGHKCLDFVRIPIPRREFNLPRVAHEEDFRKIIEAVPLDKNPNNIRNLALLHLIWDSWARAGEVVALNIEDLNFNDDLSGHAVIRTEKSRGRRPIREIFWTPHTGTLLKKWLAKKEEIQPLMPFEDQAAVFTSIRKCGSYDVRGRRMTGRGVNEAFRVLTNRAGLPAMFNPHSVRHYGARQIIKSGGASVDVTNILGHSSLESSQIYTMMWGKDLEERWKLFRGTLSRSASQGGSGEPAADTTNDELQGANQMVESFIRFMQQDRTPAQPPHLLGPSNRAFRGNQSSGQERSGC